MLSELRDDNSLMTGYMREVHEICAKYNDVATTSLIEVWIDEEERRTGSSRKRARAFKKYVRSSTLAGTYC
jgi:hypothetical protein